MLKAPSWLVVLVYVEPALFVPTMMTGIRPVKPLDGEAVDIDVRVEVGPVTVWVCCMVIG